MTKENLLVILDEGVKSPYLGTDEEVRDFLKDKKTTPIEYADMGRIVFFIENKYLRAVSQLWGGGYRLNFTREINMDYCKTTAIKYLTDAVDEQGLTSGDRKIIRDIALNSFSSALEFALTPSGRYLNLEDCLMTNLHWGALNELERYGFRISTSRYDCNNKKWINAGNLA